jgi:hypothetical protein
MRHTLNGYHPGELTPRETATALGREYIDTGLIGQILGALAMYAAGDVPTPAFWLACLLYALGTVLMMIGSFRHATYLGYRGWIAALGLLSILGLVILHCLPDRIERGRGRRGFDVMMPQKVSTLWVGMDQDPNDPSSSRRTPPHRVPWKL